MKLLQNYRKKKIIEKRKNSFEYISNLDIDSLIDSIEINKELVKHVKVIEKTSAEKISPKLKDKLENNDGFKVQLNKFLENYRFTYLFEEIIMANKIIKSKFPFDTYRKYNYYKAYLHSIEAEIEAGNLSKGDKIIFIGSGPLPTTLIMMYEHYGIKSIGIEIIPKVAELSRKLIRSLNLSDKIEIVTGDHFSIETTENIKHVIVALAAEPKDEILQWLKPILSKNTSISYRFSKDPKPEGKLKDLVKNPKRWFREYDGYKTIKIIYPSPPTSNIIAIVEPLSKSKTIGELSLKEVNGMVVFETK